LQVFNYNEFEQDISKVFDAALVDEVIINGKDGTSYKLLALGGNSKEKSPLEDIPCIKASISTQEIVEILRKCRAGID
jgi:hypothetical protein